MQCWRLLTRAWAPATPILLSTRLYMNRNIIICLLVHDLKVMWLKMKTKLMGIHICTCTYVQERQWKLPPSWWTLFTDFTSMSKQITHSNFCRLVQCWSPSARAWAPGWQTSLHSYTVCRVLKHAAAATQLPGLSFLRYNFQNSIICTGHPLPICKLWVVVADQYVCQEWEIVIFSPSLL